MGESHRGPESLDAKRFPPGARKSIEAVDQYICVSGEHLAKVSCRMMAPSPTVFPPIGIEFVDQNGSGLDAHSWKPRTHS
jgi:hypothetical protein